MSLPISPVRSAAEGRRNATLGCFIWSEDDRLFGITAKHVTDSATGNVIYYRDSNTPLGKTNCTGNDSFHGDVDVFLVNTEEVSKVDTDFRNISNNVCEVSLFTGTVDDLYGRDLFVRGCKMEEDVVDDMFGTDRYAVQKVTVAGQGLHEEHSTSLEGISFLVENTGGFLTPGQSGSILFSENVDGSVELVGVLSGGFGKDNNFIICTLLSKGIDFVEDKLITRFKLQNKCRRFSVSNVCHGSHIAFKFYKRPLFNRTGFNLLYQIEIFIDTCNEDHHSTQPVVLDHSYERQLFQAVHKCQDIEDIMADSPDQKSFHCLMLSCQNIYRGQFEAAEKKLKCAYMCAIQAACQRKMIAKLIQLYSLYWLRSNDVENMEKLFEISKAFMEKIDTTDFESSRILGYFFMNYAWYYDRKRKVDKALVLADNCLRLFQKYKEHTKEKLQGYNLSHVLMARLYLGRGEFLDRTTSKIDNEFILKAEQHLKCVDRDDFPVVKTHYRLALSELLFCQGEYMEAVSIARECRQIAVQHNLKDAEKQADAHIAVLNQVSANMIKC